MNPKCPEAHDEKPFIGMTINETSVLDSVDGRRACKICNKSRKYFCYTCYIPVEDLGCRIPQLKLPVKIDIVKHQHEIDGKSTAIHAAVLAPHDVRIYTYPDIPDYRKEEGVVLIFPSINAVPISDLFLDKKECNRNYMKDILEDLPPGHNLGTLLKKRLSFEEELPQNICIESFPIKKAVFIDSTWNQSRGIYKDDRIKSICSVVLQNRASQFWRHQKKSPRWYLSTIEAIHQFLLEVHLNAWGLDSQYKGPYCHSRFIKEKSEIDQVTPYNGQYDNLLFFFKHMYEKIHQYYNHEDLKAYKRPM